jgi:hypothetical protein
VVSVGPEAGVAPLPEHPVVSHVEPPGVPEPVPEPLSVPVAVGAGAGVFTTGVVPTGLATGAVVAPGVGPVLTPGFEDLTVIWDC